ncbi:MAG: 16S rRNA (guanine(966)-N(2))-methyltransferase RsmD [Clostridia bacterium]|nr:16S rRNA (guanine(966)-N(2))-methyltransferase RsmD [Clostridia bacterium]
MRIIGGKYRSRVLAEFPGEDVRPTSDRVKESLFNILSLKMYGARVLDLFSGSGALGLECLSRGAKEVTFNDFSKDSIAILKKNLATLKIAVNGEEAKVCQYDFAACLDVARGAFDIIFLDPPYRFDYGRKALEKIAKRNLLTETGIVVYERDRAFVGAVDGLEQYDERKYGKTYLTFFRRVSKAEESEKTDTEK